MNERDVKDCANRLDWLALCYAAGELDAAETEQFELQMADDQAAREALARAVELTQVVAAAESQSQYLVRPAAVTRSQWQTRLSWMAVGGLASLLLALLWSGVVGPTWRSLNASSRQQLASAWNQTRSELAEVREAGLWSVSSDNDDELSTEMLVDDSAVEDAPSWMMAAVFSGSKQSVDSDATTSAGNQRLEN